MLVIACEYVKKMTLIMSTKARIIICLARIIETFLDYLHSIRFVSKYSYESRRVASRRVAQQIMIRLKLSTKNIKTYPIINYYLPGTL